MSVFLMRKPFDLVVALSSQLSLSVLLACFMQSGVFGCTMRRHKNPLEPKNDTQVSFF